MNNQTNTPQGTNVEILFKNSILDHPKAWALILQSIGRTDLIGVKVIPRVIGHTKRKGDVVIEADDHAPVRVSVKSYTNAGYNHIERRHLHQFCDRNQISPEDVRFLERAWLRKARNGGQGKLIEWNERDRVRKIFKNIEPAVSAILGNDHPQILALYNIAISKWHLYDINEQVLPLVRYSEVGFTTKSSNIELGDYVVLQRKGSAKGEKGADIHHIDHGSNNIQIKMKVKRFFNNVPPAAWYRL